MKRLGDERDLAAELFLARGEASFNALRARDGVPDLERAAALQSEMGGDEALLVETLSLLASSLQQIEDYARANATFARALALAQRVLGARHPRAIMIATNAGSCLAASGHYAAAADELAQALVAEAELYPPSHPDRLTTMHMRADALRGLGRYDESIALHRDALAVEEKQQGDALGSLALGYVLLAQSQVDAGRGTDARASLERALAANHAHLGDNPVLATDAELLRALSLLGDGRFDDAAAALGPLEARVEKEIGSSTELAMTHDGIGRTLVHAGRAADAVARHEKALAMLESHYGAQSLVLTPTLRLLGEALVAAGRAADARPVLERAVAILGSEPSNPLELAEVRFTLARAIGPGTSAAALFEEVRTFVRSSPYPRAARLAEAIRTITDP
ncbi:MAG: tetratricopeptide repeat protein [Myxococcota bacterium]